MINLQDEKDYFILVDGQGASFGGGRIFENIEEIAEQFQEWADSDGYDDPKLIGWTIGDCISNWTFELKYYTGTDFVEAPEKFINYTITK
jgi:hypothetical protein